MWDKILAIMRKNIKHTYPRTEQERDEAGQNLYRFHLRFMGVDTTMDIRRPTYRRANETFKRTLRAAETRMEKILTSRDEWMKTWKNKTSAYKRKREVENGVVDLDHMTFFDLSPTLP